MERMREPMEPREGIVAKAPPDVVSGLRKPRRVALGMLFTAVDLGPRVWALGLPLDHCLLDHCLSCFSSGDSGTAAGDASLWLRSPGGIAGVGGGGREQGGRGDRSE